MEASERFLPYFLVMPETFSEETGLLSFHTFQSGRKAPTSRHSWPKQPFSLFRIFVRCCSSCRRLVRKGCLLCVFRFRTGLDLSTIFFGVAREVWAIFSVGILRLQTIYYLRIDWRDLHISYWFLCNLCDQFLMPYCSAFVASRDRP